MKTYIPIFLFIFLLVITTNVMAQKGGSPPSNDDYADAIEISDLDDWCSAKKAYTSKNATADNSAGSCWDTSPDNNVWFYFVATTENISIIVSTGGSEGSSKKINVALWESDGTAELACEKYASSEDDVALSYDALTISNTYYVSVDNFGGKTGTFTLCASSTTFDDYYGISDGDWYGYGTWSSASGGDVVVSCPDSEANVEIAGVEVEVTEDAACDILTMNVESSNTKLIINGVDFSVSTVLLTNSGTNKEGEINVKNGGSFSIDDDMIITRTGGNKVLKVKVKDGSTMIIGRDLVWDSDGGSSKKNKLTISNTATLAITRDLKFDYSGGEKILTSIEDDASIIVGRDIYFISNAENKIEIDMTTNGFLKLTGDFVRGTPAYGRLECNDNSTVEFIGSASSQELPEDAGEGSDFFSYENVIINNTFGTSPQITTEGVSTINGVLTLTDGIIASTAANIITFASGSSTDGSSNASFITGPIKKIGDSEFTFPCGAGTIYAPVGISAPGSADAAFICEYFDAAPSNSSNLGDGVESLSGNEYWDVHRDNGVSPEDDIFVTFYWEDGDRSGISSLDNLIMVHYDGAVWEDMGSGSTTGDESAGSITSNVKFSSFSGGGTGEGEGSLPIELVSFVAKSNVTQVDINWITATELNNDFFTIERSLNGLDFLTITTVKGAGNSSDVLYYNAVDYEPKNGTSYYRLKQTDFDGKFENSQMVAVSFDKDGKSCEMVVKPNPCMGKCFVDLTGCDELNGDVVFAIYDAMGNAIMANAPEEMNDGNATFSFDINNNLKPGVCIIRGGNSSKMLEKKIIIAE